MVVRKQYSSIEKLILLGLIVTIGVLSVLMWRQTDLIEQLRAEAGDGSAVASAEPAENNGRTPLVTRTDLLDDSTPIEVAGSGGQSAPDTKETEGLNPYETFADQRQANAPETSSVCDDATGARQEGLYVQGVGLVDGTVTFATDTTLEAETFSRILCESAVVVDLATGAELTGPAVTRLSLEDIVTVVGDETHVSRIEMAACIADSFRVCE